MKLQDSADFSNISLFIHLHISLQQIQSATTDKTVAWRSYQSIPFLTTHGIKTWLRICATLGTCHHFFSSDKITTKAYTGVEAQIHSLLRRHQTEMHGRLHAPAVLNQVPILQKAGWDPNLVWTFWCEEKYLPPAKNGTRPRSSNPKPSH